MQTLISGSRTLYAAIEAHYTDGAAERFVIAYTCEESLRELLAARSIVASGCPTREYAEEVCRGETLGDNLSQERLPYVFGSNTVPRFERRSFFGGDKGLPLDVSNLSWRMASWDALDLDSFSGEKLTARVRNTWPYADSLTPETHSEPEVLTSLPQHSGRSGKLDRSHPPPRA